MLIDTRKFKFITEDGGRILGYHPNGYKIDIKKNKKLPWYSWDARQLLILNTNFNYVNTPKDFPGGWKAWKKITVK